MAPGQLDTSPESAALQRNIINAKSPSERAEMVSAMCTGVTEISKAGIRRQYPDADEGEVMIHLLTRRYGADFVTALPADAITKIKLAQAQ